MLTDPWARSLPSGLWMEAMRLDADAIQRLVDGDIKCVVVSAQAEFDIAGNAAPIFEEALLVGRSGGQEGQLFTLRIDDHQPGFGETADGHVDVALAIDTHAVGAVLLAEIHQRFRSPLMRPSLSSAKA